MISDFSLGRFASTNLVMVLLIVEHKQKKIILRIENDYKKDSNIIIIHHFVIKSKLILPFILPCFAGIICQLNVYLTTY